MRLIAHKCDSTYSDGLWAFYPSYKAGSDLSGNSACDDLGDRDYRDYMVSAGTNTLGCLVSDGLGTTTSKVIK